MRHALNRHHVHHPGRRSVRGLVAPGNGPRHMLGRAMLVALVLTSGGLALAATVPAAAATHGSAAPAGAVITPRISVSPTTAAPGQQIIVHGVGGWLLDTPVVLHLNSASGPALGSVYPHGTANSNSFNRETSVPTGTKVGSHKIIGVQGPLTGSTTIWVS